MSRNGLESELNFKIGEQFTLDTKIFPTDNPSIWVKRSSGNSIQSDQVFPPNIYKIGDDYSRSIAISEFIYTDDVEISLGHKIGLSIPFTSETLAATHQAIENVDQRLKPTLLNEIIDLCKQVNPHLVITNIVTDLNPYNRSEREVHISLGGNLNGNITALYSIGPNWSFGNPSYGENGTLNPDTRGDLDSSGRRPYLTSKLEFDSPHFPKTFAGWIGETKPVVVHGLTSTFMVFAGIRIHKPIPEIVSEFHKEAVLGHLKGKPKHGLPRSIDPYLTVRKVDKSQME